MDDSIRRRDTLETYSGLVRIEVKALSGRMSEISEQIISLSENLGALLLDVEDRAKRMDALQSGLDFNRSEILELKKKIAAQEKLLVSMQQQIDSLLESVKNTD